MFASVNKLTCVSQGVGAEEYVSFPPFLQLVLLMTPHILRLSKPGGQAL
jgi:hypothetical protein